MWTHSKCQHTKRELEDTPIQTGNTHPNWEHPYTPKGGTNPLCLRTDHTQTAGQLDSTTRAHFTASRGQAASASIKGPFLCASPCQTSRRSGERPSSVTLHPPCRNTSHQNLLALATSHRSNARLPSPVTMVTFSPTALLGTPVLREFSSLSREPAFGW
jgi:hypothetical protein